MTTQIHVPEEHLRAGPWGYRVQVVDYDASSRTAYKPFAAVGPSTPDRYLRATDKSLICDPRFHCQNVYALVMNTLARFERALGRRIRWGFYSHHLIVVPHAFREANAYYSPEHHALLFGYFTGRSGKTVYTCLSHDVIVHETTHALLHGLRERFNDPSSPDQAAFHEGFADIVALLSAFALKEVVAVVLEHAAPSMGSEENADLILESSVTVSALRTSGLLGLANELGSELSSARGDALRRSALLNPSTFPYQDSPDFREPHKRGEILVAAVMNTFLEIWSGRIKCLREVRHGFVARERVVDEGADIADVLLTAFIRAIDYTPPIHLEFGDYLSAMLTSDREARPNDEKYNLRKHLRRTFLSYGISPASLSSNGEWEPAPPDLSLRNLHLEAMRTSPDEVFRYMWQNATQLRLNQEAYSRVISVRPTIRIAPDGFMLQETVGEYHQMIILKARELRRLGIQVPEGMAGTAEVRLRGGGTLIFDEYGHLKYHIHNDVANALRQSARLRDLSNFGANSSYVLDYSQLHRARRGFPERQGGEEW